MDLLELSGWKQYLSKYRLLNLHTGTARCCIQSSVFSMMQISTLHNRRRIYDFCPALSSLSMTKYWFSVFPRGVEVSDAEALVTMSMIISGSKNAPLLLFSGVDVRDFSATLVLAGWNSSESAVGTVQVLILNSSSSENTW